MSQALTQFGNNRKKYSGLLQQVQQACARLLALPEAQEAQSYLNKRINPNCQEQFGFGFFPKDEDLHLLFEIVPKTVLEKIGLVYPYHVQNDDCRIFTDKGVFSDHNLIWPYYDEYGNMVALMGRTILPELERKTKHLQKYKYARGPNKIRSLQFKKGLHLFGISAAKRAILERDCVIVVEGQIDCITCHEYGLNNVVALGGTSFTKYQFNLLRRLTNRIYLLLDNDAEGLRSQEKIVRRYKDRADIRKLSLPNGYKDVDECLRAGGRINGL